MFEKLTLQNTDIALSDFEKTLSYAELYMKVQEISKIWKENNITKILLCSSNSIDWCVYYLSAFLNGLTVFVVPTFFSRSLCESIVKTNDIQFLFIDGKVTIKENRNNIHEQIEGVSTVFFTSGTTGMPKGVMLTRENIVSNIEAINDYMQNSYKDNLLIVKPLYHSSTLTGELLVGINRGTAIYIYKGDFFPQKVVSVLNDYPITILCAVPSMIASILKYKSKYAGQLRLVSVSGSYANRNLLEQALRTFQCEIYNVYGLTEASPRVTCLKVQNFLGKIESIGRTIRGVRVEICKENGELTMQANIEGELVVSGSNVMKGYLDNIDQTKERIRDNKLYTGDIGYYDDDGFIYLTGRKDDMICRSGINIYPKTIEEVISKIDGVNEVFVFGVKDDFYSNKIVACIGADDYIKKGDVIKMCNKCNVQSPDDVFLIHSLPKTQLGKIDREKIKLMYKNN